MKGLHKKNLGIIVKHSNYEHKRNFHDLANLDYSVSSVVVGLLDVFYFCPHNWLSQPYIASMSAGSRSQLPWLLGMLWMEGSLVFGFLQSIGSNH